MSCSQNIVLFITLNDRYAIMHCRACRAIGAGILGAKGGVPEVIINNNSDDDNINNNNKNHIIIKMIIERMMIM